MLAREYGVKEFLEIGPGSALKNMMQQIEPQISSYALGDFRSIADIYKIILS